MTSRGGREPRRARRSTLSRALTSAILPLILLPTILLGGAGYLRVRATLRAQVVTQLGDTVDAQAASLSSYHASRVESLEYASRIVSLTQSVTSLLSVIDSGTQLSLTNQLDLINGAASSARTLFTGLLIVRQSDGLILASTPGTWAGLSLPASLISPVEATTTLASGIPLEGTGDVGLLTQVPLPLPGREENVVLIGVASDSRVAALLLSSMFVGTEGSQVYLVGEQGEQFRLDSRTMRVAVDSASGLPIFQALQSEAGGSAEFERPDGLPVVAVYKQVPGWRASLVVELPQAQAFAALNVLAPFMAILVIALSLLIIILLPRAMRQSLTALESLADSADRFAAGDFQQRVPSGRSDEIGRLADAFNRMAADLAQSYGLLEAKVEARTKQIRTAAEIGREAASILDLDSLLNQVVDLISSRFGFYHAGVFLLDEAGEYAVLRAASSEGGKRMLQRGHRLQIGKVGIVGYVTGAGKARISLDVGKDAAHLVNPDLPATRSEMALPLKVGDTVIGALDVQSVENDAFDDADVAVLQIMADQLAIAIQNTRLIEEQSLLASRRRKVIEVFQQLMRLGTYDRLLADIARLVREALEYSSVVVTQLEGSELVVRSVSAERGVPVPSVGEVIPMGHGILGRAASNRAPAVSRERETDALASSVEPGSPVPRGLAVPLLSRGQVIGSLAVQATEPGEFTSNDIETLELLASQLGASLDNARLFEETESSLRQVDVLYRRQTTDSWRQIAGQLGEKQLVASIDLAPSDQSQEGTGARLQIPIAMRGEPVGSIEIEGIPGEEIAADNESILRAVSEEVAGALEQARLLEELNRKATQLLTAAEIARDATGLLDLGTLLSRAVNLIRERFQFYQVSVYLLDEARQFAHLLETAGKAGQALKQRTRPIPLASRTVVGHVATTGKSYVVHDKTRDGFYQEEPALPDTESEAGIPLRIGEHVLGVLDVRHTAPSAFGEDGIGVLTALADQLAVAIQNARLYEQAIRRARREQSLIEIAGKIRSNQTIDGMLQTAVSELRRALRARQGRIWLANLDREAPKDGGSDKT